MNSSSLEKEIKLGSHFKMCLSKKLGSGAFGQIFHGKHREK